MEDISDKTNELALKHGKQIEDQGKRLEELGKSFKERGTQNVDNP
ncbi:MAG: hypothetical protein ACOC07_20950 [Coleofasciculus sp.]